MLVALEPLAELVHWKLPAMILEILYLSQEAEDNMVHFVPNKVSMLFFQRFNKKTQFIWFKLLVNTTDYSPLSG